MDTKPLRAELVPITTNARERIKQLLLNMARDATLAALDDLQARIALLRERPTQLDEFMAYQVKACLEWTNRGAYILSLTCGYSCNLQFFNNVHLCLCTAFSLKDSHLARGTNCPRQLIVSIVKEMQSTQQLVKLQNMLSAPE